MSDELNRTATNLKQREILRNNFASVFGIKNHGNSFCGVACQVERLGMHSAVLSKMGREAQGHQHMQVH